MKKLAIVLATLAGLMVGSQDGAAYTSDSWRSWSVIASDLSRLLEQASQQVPQGQYQPGTYMPPAGYGTVTGPGMGPVNTSGQRTGTGKSGTGRTGSGKKAGTKKGSRTTTASGQGKGQKKPGGGPITVQGNSSNNQVFYKKAGKQPITVQGNSSNNQVFYMKSR
jgi:hypothetical protein